MMGREAYEVDPQEEADPMFAAIAAHRGDERVPLVGLVSARQQTKACCGGRLTKLQCAAATTIGLLVFVVSMAAALYATVGKHQAQEAVNAARMEITMMKLSNPTNNSVSVQTIGNLISSTSGSQSDAVLHESTLEMVFLGQVVGSMIFPEMKVSGGGLATPLKVDNVLTIASDEAFASFGRAMIQQDRVTFELRGDVRVSPIFDGSKLPSLLVHMHHNISVSACQGLQNISVTTFSLLDSTDSALVTEATFVVNNPSIFSFEPIGNLYLNVVYEGQVIGYSLAKNVSIFPGANVLLANGQIVATTPEEVSACDKMMNLYVQGEVVAVSAVAPFNCSNFKLYAESMAGTTMPLYINGVQANLIETMDFSRLGMNVNDNSTVAMQISSYLTVLPLLGPNGLFQVINTSMSVDVFWFDPDGNMRLLGHMNSSVVPALNSTSVGFGIRTGGNLIFPDSNHDAFLEFMEQFIASDQTLAFQGTASAFLNTSIRKGLFLEGIPVDVNASIAGFDLFSGMNFDWISLNDGTVDSGDVEMSSSLSYVSPSPAAISLGWTNVSFGVGHAWALTPAGYLSTNDLALEPSYNKYSFTGSISTFSSNNYQVGLGKLISTLGSGVSLPVALQIADSEEGRRIPFLVEALNVVRIRSTIHSNESTLASGLDVVTPSTFINLTDPWRIRIAPSPFNIDISLPRFFNASGDFTSATGSWVMSSNKGSISSVGDAIGSSVARTVNGTKHSVTVSLNDVEVSAYGKELVGALLRGESHEFTQTWSGTHTFVTNASKANLPITLPVLTSSSFQINGLMLEFNISSASASRASDVASVAFNMEVQYYTSPGVDVALGQVTFTATFNSEAVGDISFENIASNSYSIVRLNWNESSIMSSWLSANVVPLYLHLKSASHPFVVENMKNFIYAVSIPARSRYLSSVVGLESSLPLNNSEWSTFNVSLEFCNADATSIIELSKLSNVSLIWKNQTMAMTYNVMEPKRVSLATDDCSIITVGMQSNGDIDISEWLTFYQQITAGTAVVDVSAQCDILFDDLVFNNVTLFNQVSLAKSTVLLSEGWLVIDEFSFSD